MNKLKLIFSESPILTFFSVFLSFTVNEVIIFSLKDILTPLHISSWTKIFQVLLQSSFSNKILIEKIPCIFLLIFIGILNLVWNCKACFPIVASLVEFFTNLKIDKKLILYIILIIVFELLVIISSFVLFKLIAIILVVYLMFAVTKCYASAYN